MNELRVVRGTDIRLFADEAPLFGITSFTAEEKPKFHEVYEYLNAKPCERIPQGGEYVIRIGMMAMFDHQLSECEGFSLTSSSSVKALLYRRASRSISRDNSSLS